MSLHLYSTALPLQAQGVRTREQPYRGRIHRDGRGHHTYMITFAGQVTRTEGDNYMHDNRGVHDIARLLILHKPVGRGGGGVIRE